MELLTAISEPDDLAKMVPAASELMERYGLDAAIAFDIGRPKLRLAMKVRSSILFSLSLGFGSRQREARADPFTKRIGSRREGSPRSRTASQGSTRRQTRS